MRHPRILSGLAVLLSAALQGPVLTAQTTGSLQGRVLDPRGNPVRGATVRLSGSGVQGMRATSTDTSGAYRFNLLAPGRVTLTATAEGFNAAKAEASVGLDRTATVDLALAPVSAATVEVVGSASTVDTTAAATGLNFTNETFQKLPVSRDFANIALLAPGVTEDREGFKVYGGTGAENNYVVDGVNTTNVEFGTQGKRVPMEFVQEFQVKTGGYEAEYGKAMGGIINVITKSGGNEFAGDAFLYSEGEFLKSGNRHVDDVNQRTKPLLLENKTLELGFDFGGYLVKDRLWFFVAYDRRSNKQQNQIRVDGPTFGQTAPTDSTRDLFAAKLTWQVAAGHTLIAQVLGDPEKITGAVKTPQGDRGTWDGEKKVGGNDFSLRYEAVGSNWFGQLQVSRHKETNAVLPGSGASAVQIIDNTLNGAQSGGFGRFDDKTFTRDNLSGSFAYVLGGHELKAGFDLQTDKADIRRGFTGGQLVTKLQSGPAIYSHYWWTTADASISPFNAPSITFTSSPKHDSQAYFLQDKWSVTPRLVLNLGVRLDQTDIKDQFGATVISLKDQWSPRLGFIYDFRGKGLDKVYGSFSRYYEQVPLDLVIRSFSVERNPTTYNFSATSFTPDTAAEAILGTEAGIVGSYVEPVDPDLKGSYSDELILGVETTWNQRYLLGAKIIRRTIGRAIEDGLDVNSPLGDYFIMNPGYSHPAGVTYPKAKREFTGLEFSAQRRFADRYTWQASYLWSHLKGNYEGAFQGIGGPDGTGQLDPNINSAFDLPEFIVNSEGDLSGDRRHQFKANGYYEWDWGLSLGAALQVQTGTPISRLGYHNGYGRYELFLTPRGTEGRSPTTARLDINLAYSWKLPNKHQVRFNFDITNLLNSQTATVVDQRFDSVEGGPKLDTFRQPFAYQAPRAVRFGIRYSF
jgi:hypothetical protein